jgi:hypothetical protein
MGTALGTSLYIMSGKQHGDTVIYKDEDLLAGQAGGKMPEYITAIRVWHDDYIYALEVFYDGVSSGVRKANNTHPAQQTDIILAFGEHITQISGRHGDIIDHLEFTTTAGKVYNFGTSAGGVYFAQSGGIGTVVKAITTGWGGQLHLIGAHWGVPYIPYIQSAIAGKVHPDTVHFDDFTGSLAGFKRIRIVELRVLHDGNHVYGIEAIYSADGTIITGGSHHGPLNLGVVNQAVPLPEGTLIVGFKGNGGD